MAKFAYNNAKNTSISHTSFKYNCNYHPRNFFEDQANLYSKFYSAKQLAKKLQDPMSICQQNLLYAHQLQKQANDKGVKSRSYAPGKKI